ncbi:hypothetical protein AAVH_21760, partial [Aphelenchoides avenae]
ECLIAELIVTNPYYQAVEWIYIALTTLSTALLIFIVRLHCRASITFHKNLLVVLLGFAIAFIPRDITTFATCLLNQVRLRTYTDPCSLQTVGWVVLILRAPRMFCTIVSTCFLVSVLAERTYAFRAASSYENCSPKLGTALLLISVLLGLVIPCVLYHNYPVSALHSAINTSSSSEAHIVALTYYTIVVLLDLATVICLYFFKRLNASRKKRLRESGDNYTLAESYQLGENVTFVTAFMPVATAYAILTTAYHLAVLVMRKLVTTSVVDLIVWIEALYAFSVLSTVLCLAAYAFRIWRLGSKASTRVHPALTDEGTIYFDHFRMLLEGPK